MGKNYICSDIHGMKGSYENALKQLKDDDKLYILGDAIDRGDEGIQILIDIMQHSGEQGKKPKIEYIIGNHDLMFIENMETIMKHKIGIKNQADLDLWPQFEKLCYELELARLGGEEGRTEFDTIKKKITWLKDISFEEMLVLAEHIYNDGRHTIFNFMRMKDNVQEQLYNFMENCYIQKQINIEGKNYVITHAAPIPVPTKNNQGITLKQARSMIQSNATTNIQKDKRGLYDYISARGTQAVKEWQKWHQKGYYTICGHTPKRGTPDIDYNLGRIIIDTETAYNGDLALVNIDAGELTMIGTKGTINGQSKDYRPNSYENQRKLVKDFFNSVPIAAKEQILTRNITTKEINILQQTPKDDNIYTSKISDLPAQKSYVTKYKEMKNRMENGEKPTQDDYKILNQLSTQKLDSQMYTEQERQTRIELLKWGRIIKQTNQQTTQEPIASDTAKISDLPAQKSYVTKYKEMKNRMENGEKPTQDDYKILNQLSTQKLDPQMYTYQEEQTRIELLEWGGIIKQTNQQSTQELFTEDDYSEIYNLTDIEQIDAIIQKLKEQKKKIQSQQQDGQTPNMTE